MYSTNKTIRTVSLIGAFVLAATTARAVDPPPDGGYPNENTAEGEDALFSLTSGFENTAIGFNALFNLTTGRHNTATGYHSLFGDTVGFNNTADGWEALENNTSGFKNTATGCDTLHTNTTGFQNTASGVGALRANSIGSDNTANGFEALNKNTIGGNNTANGSGALHSNRTGSSNIALGFYAGFNLTTGDNNIDIFDQGVAGEANTIRIGTQGTHNTTFIAGINGSTVPEGAAVIIDMTGHLGTVTSSARYKKNIQPMNDESEKLLSLHPVTFEYKEELDPKRIPQFGLVAEDVAKVDPDLVAKDDEGKPYTVRYEAVNAMLLNEFLKAHKKIDEQASQLSDQTNEIAQLKASLKNMFARLDANGL